MRATKGRAGVDTVSGPFPRASLPSSLAAIKGQSHEILYKFKDQESAAECPIRSFRGLLVAQRDSLMKAYNV